ncbi:transcriptional activator FtrA [Vibrio campbellii]|uniref:helix-turn-helix domain-containing protein n=1 Tax=Vibrio campbellii TaxID=680 RepID=UPI00097FBBDA|nr:AraC family transcriptional regulator [Vibrio campbellii]AQM67471.1 transcriptional activator FtrA [Vibrio campbellii]
MIISEVAPHFEVFDIRKNNISLLSIEDKFYFIIDVNEFALKFNDKKYGVFLSYDHNGESINEFIYPTLDVKITIQVSTKKGIVIFFPLTGFTSLCKRKPVNKAYGVIINSLRNNLSDDEYKRNVEINGITGLVLISLVEAEREKVIDKIVDFIRDNITNEKLSLDYVANNVYMSKRKLQYIFSSSGTTYKKTLNSVKVELLKFYINNNPEVSIKQILPLCGFNSHSSANSIFKMSTGESIYKYQKRIANS